MLYWTDFHLERDFDDARIAEALAAAFRVAPPAVAITAIGDAAGAAWEQPGLEVFVQRDNINRAGEEFPVTLMVTLRKADRIDDPIAKARSFARALGVAMLTDIEAEGDAWRLFMPDGRDRVVYVDPTDDDQGRLSLQPSDRFELERSYAALSS